MSKMILSPSLVAVVLLTPSEVADLFGVGPKTVARWSKAGKLPAQLTVGGHRRYRESDVRALLAGAAGEVMPS